MSHRATTAIVLARGLGSRMRKDAPDVVLTPQQQATAAVGLKAMIPDSKHRPFLDHILSSLADGGIQHVILVVAPDHTAIREHYATRPPSRVHLEYAVQAEPRGTADALLSAETATAGRDFLVCNSDNLYPVSAITALATLDGPGVAAFDRQTLITESNIDPARVAAFAMLSIDDAHHLTHIIEKPSTDDLHAHSAQWIGMNLWRFDTGIFSACRDVPLSSRGEHELPQAVALAISRGMRITAVPMHAGVLDLSNRGDINTVAAILGQQEAHP